MPGKSNRRLIFSSILILIVIPLTIVFGITVLHDRKLMSSVINKKILIATYLSGIPFDLIHAGSTVLFLFFIEKPMAEKITRIKVKYGLIDENELLKTS